MYRKLPIQLKLALLLLLTSAAAAYSYYESVEPAFAAHQAALDEMDTLEQEIEKLNKAGQSIVAIETELRKADEDISLLLDLLPGDPEVDRVLGYFATASKETGVEIRDFEPEAAGGVGAQGAPTPPAPNDKKESDTPAVEHVSKTPIKLKLHGSFVQLTSFLDRVLGLPRVIRVVSFDFKAAGGSDKAKETPPGGSAALDENSNEPGGTQGDAGSSPTLSADITFEAYSQKETIDQFKKEERAPTAPNPIAAPDVGDGLPVSADGAPPPGPDGAALSAKPLPAEGGGQ